MTSTAGFEPGSFRDRRARVLRRGDGVYRLLDETAHRHWRHLAATTFHAQGVADGRIVRSEEVPAAERPPELQLPGYGTLLRHEPVPFVSYPYEWCFHQLKDAALLHLGLLAAALAEGMILKDSSAYNIQWRGSRPLFIDIPSFEQLAPGEPWVGYRQFCEMFLNPLLLQAYRGVRFQPWLRGRLAGIPTEELARAMSWRDRLRPGVLGHVVLHARLQRSGAATGVTRASLKDAGFGREIIAANARGLERIVAGLTPRSASSHWTSYASSHSYGDDGYAAKQRFVEEVAAEARPRLAWDVGCNTGDFSRILAKAGAYVIAMDADEGAVDALYQRLAAEREARILPLVIDVVDPSTALGWRARERASLEERGRPDLVLALALVHHVVIGANVPLPDFVDWLASLRAAVVLEFVTRRDEMVAALLRNKEDVYLDYSQERLEAHLGASFDIRRRVELKGGMRTLYHAVPRGSGA